ncbi:MAG: hypothetical protein VYA70_08790 [Gemmatimonadota bacterium]|nr:hypothetical protein [Gemmatimonadota bacterium]
MIGLLVVFLVLLIPILAIVLDSDLGRALAGRMERPGLPSGDAAATAERLAYLEGEVERLTTEMGKLEEESQFLNNLLTERPASQLLPPGDQSG